MNARILLLFVAFIFAFKAFCMDSSTLDDDEKMLKFRVGGQVFYVDEKTVAAYPESPLAIMFKTPMKPGRMDSEGCIILHNDPDAFKNILFWMRNKKIPFASIAEAERTLPDARYLCLKMVPDVEDYIANRMELVPKVSKHVKDGIQKEELVWQVFRKDSGKCIGNPESGWIKQSTLERFIAHRATRAQLPEVFFILDVNFLGYYNLIKEHKIGYSHGKLYTDEIENTHTQILNHVGRCICAINQKGKFSIFHIDLNSQTPLLDEVEFDAPKDCFKVLKESTPPQCFDRG